MKSEIFLVLVYPQMPTTSEPRPGEKSQEAPRTQSRSPVAWTRVLAPSWAASRDVQQQEAGMRGMSQDSNPGILIKDVVFQVAAWGLCQEFAAGQGVSRLLVCPPILPS